MYSQQGQFMHGAGTLDLSGALVTTVARGEALIVGGVPKLDWISDDFLNGRTIFGALGVDVVVWGILLSFMLPILNTFVLLAIIGGLNRGILLAGWDWLFCISRYGRFGGFLTTGGMIEEAECLQASWREP